MAPPMNGDFSDGDAAEGSDRADGSGSGSSGLAERLRDVLTGESDGDLLLEGVGGDDGVLQWLQALDLQVLGACRADERLKPLLKLSVSSGVAEERLVAQLNQHFEASEVGMLARCLCIPLVSIRVGKIHKQENLLCPSSSRGHLNLSLLPSSTMRISFTGDDGCIERLAVVASDCESPPVIIEEISADTSGRSFLLKLPGFEVSYFWCSERSKPRGVELLSKMKDLLKKKPSLSQLTGICESRINSFANHLRAYLVGSFTHAETISTTSSMAFDSSIHASSSDLHSSSRPSRSRLIASNSAKVHPFYQGSLSPRSSTFKDGMSKSSSHNRNASKEKQRRRGDGYSSSLTLSNLPVASASCTTHAPSTSQPEDNSGCNELSSDYSGSTPFHLPEIPCLSYPFPSCSHPVVKTHQSEFAVTSPSTTPCYCWSPRYPSPLQYTVSSHLPIASTECLRLPPLSSLLSSREPPVSVNASELPVDIPGLPSHNLPSLFPTTLVHFPLPIHSHGTLPSSQVPTFTPFMSDSIVHIPMIDVCSSGPGYLVSAESALSLAIPPLLPTCASPLISQTESVEMNARETLRMLMASAPPSTCPPFMTMLPQVINSSEEIFPYAHVSKCEIIAAGSRGLYSGVLDVKAVTSGLSLMTFSSSKQNHARGDLDMRISSESSEGLESQEVPGASSYADGNSSE